jgi:hypothetical protein
MNTTHLFSHFVNISKFKTLLGHALGRGQLLFFSFLHQEEITRKGVYVHESVSEMLLSARRSFNFSSSFPAAST